MYLIAAYGRNTVVAGRAARININSLPVVRSLFYPN
jgi:hypothetical protein